MKSTVEPAEGNKVKVAVEIDEAELEPAVAAAWKEISKEVRLPGFRPGKAPRRLLEKQFGGGYARSEALRSALPEFYSQAVIEHDVDVIAAPELEITGGEEEGDVTFEALVEVRPSVQVAGYDGLRVEVPRPEPTDDEINEQIDRLRSQYGELTDVDRAAGDGDYVSIDISGTQDGEPVEGLEADDYLYLIGSGMIAPELDGELTGASAGDVVEFETDHPDPDQERVLFHVEVKAVRERVLPDLDDAWVAEATEFETVDELLDDTRTRIADSRAEQTRTAVRANLGRELARLVDLEIPESMIGSEVQVRLQNMAQQLSMQGMRIDDYLQYTGRDPESFSAELRESAEEGVRVDLALRAVAEVEGLVVDDEEIAEEIAGMLGDAEVSLEEAMEQLRTGGQLSAVRSDLVKRKALEWLVERSEIVDEDGAAVPEELLTPPVHDHTDHDQADPDHPADEHAEHGEDEEPS